MTSTEQVINKAPVVIRRRVKWGECDPAAVVYTVSFTEYVISAAELFYEVLLGQSPQAAKQHGGFGTPSRALSFDFHSSLRPDELFDMTVIVEDVRSRTYVLAITARRPQGELIFEAKLTPVCVARDARRSIELPDAFRRSLLAYQQACEVTSL
ncbi:acyl-CoA thioesterase [Hydrogenophaga sp. OTU3427]|uniref:acyl-CoA thioesterase n=1 Tax=Hydrogenophaga sp. OTU3427 TaxID=3043856 RepID=UPI00313C7AEE